MPEETKEIKKIFPKDFLWGASVSSHQVEGGNHNQWTIWETQNANKLAGNAEKLLARRWKVPVWEEIKHQAQDPKNYISGNAVDHYNLYKHDFSLIKQLNLNSFRFSIEWSRIEPEEGRWNQEAIDHYKEYIAELKLRGIEPVLNIWHTTMPVWFADLGGFKHRINLYFFDRFVDKVAKEFTKHVKYVVTLNEPNVYATYSYLLGLWPPQEKNIINMVRVYRNMAICHKRAYGILKKHKPSLHIGIASQLANIQAKNPHFLPDEISTKVMRYAWNWWFLRNTRDYQDFIGVNYYFTDYYRNWFRRDSPKLPLNDRGWYMEPEGLFPLLLRTWAHYGKPIIVTESGVADMHDQYRRWWIEESIVAIERAISEGVQVKGYFHWSLLDNFEWSDGWWMKFGLVSVDRKHGMKRTIRPSAKWFASQIKKLS